MIFVSVESFEDMIIFEKHMVFCTCLVLFVFLTKCQSNDLPKNETSVNFKYKDNHTKNSYLDNTIKFELTASSDKIIDDWIAFGVLSEKILYINENEGKKTNTSKEEFKKMFKNLELNTPSSFDNNSIWSRFKVLETNIYKYLETLKTNQSNFEISKKIKNDVAVSYANIVRQINKINEKNSQILSDN